MTASEKQENLLAEKNKVSSATTIAQKPRLMASNRLFGRLAGRTLEKLASKPKTSNELKREELDKKLRDKLLAEKMEQEEKMEAARKRAREEKEEREEKAKKDLNVRKSLVSKKYELDLDRASKVFKKTKTEPAVFWKPADPTCMIR